MVSESWTTKSQDDDFVILEDNSGFYATEKIRLDNRLADPHRYASPEWKTALLRRLLPGTVQITCQDDHISLAE
jgi:hypothetical protein